MKLGEGEFEAGMVWQQAHELAIEVRRVSRAFLRTGNGALQDQVTRAAESVAFNIPEGCGSTSQREFAAFSRSPSRAFLPPG
jgi:four helix bundle protein